MLTRANGQHRKRRISRKRQLVSVVVASICLLFKECGVLVVTGLLSSTPRSASAATSLYSSDRNNNNNNIIDHHDDDNDDGHDYNKNSESLSDSRRQRWIDKYLRPYHLALFERSPPSSYRGIKTTIDRHGDGEVIFEISNSQIILASDFDDLDHLPKTARTAADTDDDEIWTQEQIIALGLLSLREHANDDHGYDEPGPNGRNYDNHTVQQDRRIYVSNILPQQQQCAVWTLPQQMWDDVVAPSLPRCYREWFEATRSHVSQFVETASKSYNNMNKYSEDDILWAFSMVRSRSVAVPELAQEKEDSASQQSPVGPPLAIIPGLDLFNHRFSSMPNDENNNVRINLNWNHHDRVWSITTSTDSVGSSADSVGSSSATSSSEQSIMLQKGDEIFLSYGDDKDNWKLLLTYGFVVRHNPNKIVFWTWEDVLDSASRVRPMVFTERTRQQLLNHPQLQMYVMLSENRATFSYDTVMDQPRQSLVNGLTILSNLATQIGGVADETLSNDVLSDLMRQRLQELESGIRVLNEVLNQGDRTSLDGEKYCLPSKWFSFVDSVRIVLEEEANALNALHPTLTKTCTAAEGS